jgi:uncharacterized protein (TIGR00645 family)
MKQIGRAFEAVIFASRWLVAPLLVGLVIGLAVLIYKFLGILVGFVLTVHAGTHEDVIVSVLKLVDISLTANLVLIVICSSYENFLAPIDPAEHPSWPHGLTGIGFSGLKQKLLGSIVAIAAVNVLEWLMDIDRHVDSVKLAWVVGILLAFAVAALILAIADRVGNTHKEPGG